jgi:hypothetical protein
MPGIVIFYFNRSEAKVYQHPILAFEIIWYSPRVLTAGAASAVLELVGYKYVSCFVYDFYLWHRTCACGLVMFACLAND